MKDFDDDPLGDLLSEGSSDSFFDDPKSKLKAATKKKEPEKETVSQLFGFENETNIKEKQEDKAKKESDWLGISSPGGQRKKIQETGAKKQIIKKVSFEGDDILDTLGLDAPDPFVEKDKPTNKEMSEKTDPKKKSSLFDDIFGTKTQKTKSDIFSEENVKDSLVTSKATPQQKVEAELPVSTSKEQTEASGFNLSSFTREGRRPRSASKRISDPLGLLSTDLAAVSSPFSSPLKKGNVHSKPEEAMVEKEKAAKTEFLFSPQTKTLHTKSATDIKNISWLEGESLMKSNKSDPALFAETHSSLLPTLQNENAKMTREASSSGRESVNTPTEPYKEHSTNPSMNPLLKSNIQEEPLLPSFLTQKMSSQSGYHSTSIALQQQESLLMMALHLKKYEENLLGIQQKQQEMLDKQEKYFRDIIEEQFLKQQSIDNSLQLQQERINKHIEMILTHSSGLNDKEKQHTQLEENIEENKVVIMLKQKQQEEIFLLEESYKKQISLLEQTLQSVEERLKKEVNDLSEYYKKMVEDLRVHHESEIERYKLKINEMSINQENELKILKESYARITEDIRNEYSVMLNNVKQIKQMEQNAFEDSGSYIKKLESSLDVLTANSSTINDINIKLESEYNILSKAREETMRAKEKEIEMMRTSLEKARQSSDAERAQLLALVRNLETKLAEQNQNAREDRWAFQQATANLVARASALDRETEFQRSIIEREKEQLKTLKENLLAEQEKLVLQLTEEKLAIQAERSRLETSAKLNSNFNARKAEAEVEAAVKLAKEATERTDRERENLFKAQHEIEILKRSLHDREQVIQLKERSLETLKEEVDNKMKAAERALAEAKALEMTYNTRIKEIQNQLTSLAQREKKLMEEKIMLSKERLAIRLDLQQMKKCSLCLSENNVNHFTPEFRAEHEIPHLVNIADLDMMRIRNEINEENLKNMRGEGDAED